MRPAALLRCGKRVADSALSIHPQSDSRIKVPQSKADVDDRPLRTLLRTAKILPANIDPTMIDATGNQVEDADHELCEAVAPALK